MAVYNAAFGAAVRDALREKGLSPYEVERRSSGAISHQTVRNMMRDVVAYSDYIVAFAEAVGETSVERSRLANELLAIAGRRLVYPQSERRTPVAA